MREQGLGLKEQDRRVNVKDHHLKEKGPGRQSSFSSDKNQNQNSHSHEKKTFCVNGRKSSR